MVRGFDLAFESNRVLIPAMGSYCLVTLMSSNRTKQICLWMTIYIWFGMKPYGRRRRRRRSVKNDKIK